MMLLMLLGIRDDILRFLASSLTLVRDRARNDNTCLPHVSSGQDL